MAKPEVDTKIVEDNEFFKSLVDLIPARVYFDQTVRDELQQENSSDITDDEGESGPLKRKKQKSSGKIKHYTVDPLESRTVTQLQEELDKKSETASDGGKRKVKKKQKKKAWQKDESGERAANLDELRERLHVRIRELKGKRGHLNPEEWLEKKRLKRRESKLKLKMKRKKEKLNSVKGEHPESRLPNGLITSPSKPVYNKEGKIVFSKFDFTDTGEKTKKPMSDLTGKDYKKILENLAKRKEKVKKLQENDVLAARELQKKTAWQMAIGKAEGVKIKDDPEMLKKAVKRKEKRKEKSAKSWEFREKKVEEKKKERQDKRQKNIDLRKQAKLKNKQKKAAKKGRIVPGF